MTGLHTALTPSARALPESGIVEVFNYGRTREGLIPLWAGEGDTPTPQLICDATAEALRDGATFYTYQRGIPPLREALASYFSNLYGRDLPPEEFFVTCGGMQAIQMAVQLVVGEGDNVVAPSPAWPNIEGAVLSRGGELVPVDMTFGNAGWSVDLDRLFDACGPRTRAMFINTPGNPTGWTATEDELKAILAFARKRGIWIIADEIYGRFHWRAEGPAPSFQTLREPEDRILFVQTFSKNWAMTGWRMGWLQAPTSLGQTIENMIQYNTSGVPTFQQPGGVAALTRGEAIAADQIERARRGREIVCGALEGRPGITFAWPDGAFYLLFKLDGVTDSLKACLGLVDEANLGLAPGSAFGAAGEGAFRLCFLRSPDQLETAVGRLTEWLERRHR